MLLYPPIARFLSPFHPLPARLFNRELWPRRSAVREQVWEGIHISRGNVRPDAGFIEGVRSAPTKKDPNESERTSL